MVTSSDLQRIYPMGRVLVRALAGVTVAIPEGAFLAIMGPSGSGKSTLLNLVGGLDRPSAGELRVAGQDLTRMDENRLANFRQQVCGFIFQSFNLVSTMTAQQNVEFPMVFARVPAGERRRRARYLLGAVGLADRVSHRPTELSGGEQQRVAVARALANSPRLLLADEPTGNLDTQTGGEIMALISQAHREGHLTVLMVTHDAGIAGHARDVLHMRDGRVLEQ